MDYQDIEPILDRLDNIAAAIDRNTAQLERVEAAVRAHAFAATPDMDSSIKQLREFVETMYREQLAEIRKEKEADNA